MDPDAKARVAALTDKSQGLEFVKHIGDDDLFFRPGNRTAIVLLGIWTGMPDDLLRAVRARRRMTVTGECPICGVILGSSDQGPNRILSEHEEDCPAVNEWIRPRFLSWIHDVGAYALGRRIQELP